MNFAGILSRKAGMRMNNNAMNNSAVSNQEEVEVAVATMEEQAPVQAPSPKASARAKGHKEVQDMKKHVVDVTPMAEPAPAPIPVQKKEAAPKQEASPAPKQVRSTASLRSRTKKAAASKQEDAPKPAPKKEASPAPKQEKPRLTLMQYSEKCMALFGDTKPIKEKLKSIGGRFNPNLHPFGNETSVPGWVFPMKHKQELEELINK